MQNLSHSEVKSQIQESLDLWKEKKQQEKISKAQTNLEVAEDYDFSIEVIEEVQDSLIYRTYKDRFEVCASSNEEVLLFVRIASITNSLSGLNLVERRIGNINYSDIAVW